METKYIVNNATGQTINGDITINGSLTITGDTSIRPYKVYTALLTQSGSSDELGIQSGDLTIGVTYRIEETSPDSDWTNVGAPNNNVGTYFVATGTTPNSWGDPGNLRYNTGAPVVTVLENTIGNVWFEYHNAGYYFIKSYSLFSSIDKCYITLPSMMSPGDDSIFIGNRTSYQNDSFIELMTFGIQVGDIAKTNFGLTNSPLEIRVYN